MPINLSILNRKCLILRSKWWPHCCRPVCLKKRRGLCCSLCSWSYQKNFFFPMREFKNTKGKIVALFFMRGNSVLAYPTPAAPAHILKFCITLFSWQYFITMFSLVLQLGDLVHICTFSFILLIFSFTVLLSLKEHRYC